MAPQTLRRLYVKPENALDNHTFTKCFFISYFSDTSNSKDTYVLYTLIGEYTIKNVNKNSLLKENPVSYQNR